MVMPTHGYQATGGLLDAPLRVFDALPSTNTWLLDRGPGCAHGETVRARCQTAGRGRSGRHWVSRSGADVTFSVALYRDRLATAPEHQGSVAALALAECLEHQYGLKPCLKWPNDVLLGHLKVAGILGESRSDVPDLVVVGIGCNVNTSASDFAAAGLSATASSLSQILCHDLDPDRVFEDLLNQWRNLIARLETQGINTLVQGWRQRDALAGRTVTADVAGRPLQARAEGLDDQLGLCLRDAAGILHILHSGEIVHIGPIDPGFQE